MPSNITTSAAFTTGNMKPSAGEQIDALWGQNLADNTGYLYYRKPLVCSFGGVGPCSSISLAGTYQGTAYFQKYPEFDHLVGSYVGTTSASGELFGWVDGVAVFSHSGAGSNWARGTSFDISSLTDGQWYTVSFMARHDSAGAAQLKGFSLWMDV